MAPIPIRDDLSDDGTERKSIDLEALPESRTPKWLRSARPHRRGLIIAGVLIILIPLTLLSLPSFGINPIAYSSLPSERPSDMSLCDYYAQQNHYWNSASTQKKLVMSIVDKAFVGAKNPKALGPGNGMLNGILRPGDWYEIPMDLRKYYDGSMKSTNVDGKPTSVNFFSGKNFTQYGREYPEGNSLFQHMKEGMYKYTAPMLGCSIYGKTVDRYSGTRSMKEVHKFMDTQNPKNWEWKYYLQQFHTGCLAAKFSDDDAGLFMGYLVSTFGSRYIKENKDGKVQAKFIPCFENPELGKSTLPPTFNVDEVNAHKEEIMSALLPNYVWKRSEAPKKEARRINENHRRDTHQHFHKRQDFSTPPPPLTTPDFAGPTTTANSQATRSSEPTGEALPASVLPIALGAGIGAGLAVIAIGIAIAYLVIRKKRIAKRQSTQTIRLKPGMIEMHSEETTPSSTSDGRPNQRVDRSEHGNVVGKPKQHKKNISVGERSVHFNDQ